jgi:hypothetical protein
VAVQETASVVQRGPVRVVDFRSPVAQEGGVFGANMTTSETASIGVQ